MPPPDADLPLSPDSAPGAREPGAREPATGITRRTLLRRGALAGAALSLPALAGPIRPAAAATLRRPGSLPNPRARAGTVNKAMPFDHIVVVMMENHSFDNVLGALAVAGSTAADGLTFGSTGAATNSNPGTAKTAATVSAFPFASTAQGRAVSQTWNATHKQIDGGRMDGFVQSTGSAQPMGYYPDTVLPFAYSLARTFTIGNRWFSSAPCQTFPNRRFLMAGTAYGNIASSTSSLYNAPPPNGTIFDRLQTHGISWRNYFSDIPQTVIIPSIIGKYFTHLAPISRFHSDCASGKLPSVSFVDPEFGLVSDVGSALAGTPFLAGISARLGRVGGDEEDPQDMYYGEKWAYGILKSVLSSPAWPRTLLIYTYDEHGGYYDHVPPPAALAPDSIPPKLGAGNVRGGYNIYGPRVPAIVVSPYSIPGGATDVVHDHTSVLATIEAKWNLPALTYRDANAATVMDFLDLEQPPLLHPPKLVGPSSTGPSGPV